MDNPEEQMKPWDSYAFLFDFRKAVRDALQRHKLLGNPIAVSRDGKVVMVQPEDIVIHTDEELRQGLKPAP